MTKKPLYRGFFYPFLKTRYEKYISHINGYYTNPAVW